MDFFAHQDKARSNTKLLIFLFILAVCAIIVILNLVAFLLLPSLFGPEGTEQTGILYSIQNRPDIFGYITLTTLGIVTIGVMYKTIQIISQGGAGLATSLGGRRLYKSEAKDKEAMLLNVVEEMAIASGIKVPSVFILEQPSINAFAAGLTIDSAVIGVTTGCINHLSRDELQGVIAHEFSHIFHGDMKINVKLIAILHGILVIAFIGELILRSRASRRNKNGQQLALLGLALFALGYIGYFFGGLIKSAVSRQREFLADASAVQYTRNPSGITGALKKIGEFKKSSEISSPNASQCSHMFFTSGVQSFLSGLFATHPPLAERISRIDRNFKYLKRGQTDPSSEQITSADKKHPSSQSELVSSFVPVGTITPEAVQKAHEIHQKIPPSIQEAASTSLGACAILIALFMEEQETISEKVEKMVRDHPQYKHISKLMIQTKSLGKDFRLPLLDLSVPSIRLMSPEQQNDLAAFLKQIVFSDQKVSLFEFCAFKILENELMQNSKRKQKGQSSMTVIVAAGMALSALAHIGHANPKSAQAAYNAGMEYLTKSKTVPPMSGYDLQQLDEALTQLSKLKNIHMRKFIEAASIVTKHDHKVSFEEQEVLRAFAAVLNIPVAIA